MGKSFLLSMAFAAAYVVLLTTLLRLFVIHKRAKAMTLLFLASLPVLATVYFFTPADLGFLAAWLTEPLFPVDLFYCLFLYTAAYGGGILQLYNLADRGFSLRIAMDIASAPAGLTLDQEAAAYSGGKGVGWMYKKRIEGLLDNRLCEVRQGRLCNLRRGTRLAKLFGRLRAFFHHPLPNGSAKATTTYRRSAA